MNYSCTTTVQCSQQWIQRCHGLPINLCIIFGQCIVFDEAELYGAVGFASNVCSDHQVSVIRTCIIVASGCVSCVHPVIMSLICVHSIYDFQFAYNCTCVLVGL